MGYLSVAVRGLPRDVSRADVRSYIKGFRDVVDCMVGPIVQDVRRTSASTVVTFRSSGRDCDKIKESLHGSTFHGSSATTLSVTDEFLGLTALSGEPDAATHIYIVHGIGGNAFRSFSSDVQHEDITTLKNWTQDFLPSRLAEEGIKARVYTIGYSANLMKSAAPDATVNSAAEDLLAELYGERSAVHPRKIYFVCHSLGGLVVCKALSMSLFMDEDYGNNDHYRNLFLDGDECLLKGIVFLGTPFAGTGTADLFIPFIKAVRRLNFLSATSDKFLSALSTQQPVDITRMFRQAWSVIRERDIKILVGCEERPVAGSKLVANYASATGMFGNHALVFRIMNRDHRKMIKFGQMHDAEYKKLEDNIVRMIKDESVIDFRDRIPTPDVQRTNTEPVMGQSWRTHGGIAPIQNPPQWQSRPMSGISQGQHSIVSNQQQSTPHQQYFGGGLDHPSYQDLTPSLQSLNLRQHAIGTSNPTYQPQRSPNGTADLISEGDNNNIFNKLQQFDTVFLIDDTGSMCMHTNHEDAQSQTRREAARSALARVGAMSINKDQNGVDLRFLIDEREEDNITDINDLLGAFDSTPLDFTGGGTFLLSRLENIVGAHMEGFREFYHKTKEHNTAVRRAKNEKRPAPALTRPERPKFLNLIVLTDGAADDKDWVKEYIIDVARELDDLKAPSPQVGIQFVQLGDDKDAANFLDELDNDLKNQPDRQIRDIVDTTNFNSERMSEVESYEELLEDILLGAIDKAIDNRKPNSRPRSEAFDQEGPAELHTRVSVSRR